jgi:23S rRNA (cytidine1920-2'-O)/16S rRNA (cytidine1409-2'-O)-methyltransferase
MKKRLDEFISETYKIPLNVAQSIILQGFVLVNNQKILKKNFIISNNDSVQLIKDISFYPSRSAYKLKDAVDSLKLQDKIMDKICVDIGASHGGFTKVLLDYGAKKIYAIDVAKGIIAYQLRIDPKVILLEEKNIKHITIDDFQKQDYFILPWFITCDVSFMSIITIFETLQKWIEIIKKDVVKEFYFYGIFLLKPQFEDSQSTIKGIIKDSLIRESIITERIKRIQEMNFQVLEHLPASIKGTKGNQEEILYVKSC